MSKPHIKLALSNVSMNLGHDGLSKIMLRFGVNSEKMGPGECVLFLNKQRDKLKLIGGQGIVLGYVRMPKGQTLPVGAVQYVSEAFSRNGSIDIDGAVSKYVTQKLLKRGDVASRIEASG